MPRKSHQPGPLVPAPSPRGGALGGRRPHGRRRNGAANNNASRNSSPPADGALVLAAAMRDGARPGCGGAPPIVGNTSCDRCTWAYIASAPGVGDDVCTACALSGRRDALNASTIGGHAPAIACFMGRTLPQWAAARAALQRGAPPPHNVWISDVLLVVAVTLTGALLVAIAAVVALRREGWGHRVKASA